MSSFRFLFPECTKRSNSIEGQISHIKMEVEESADALRRKGRDDLIVELLDVIHATETAIRMLMEKDGISEDDMDGYCADVVRKNDIREYYAKKEGVTSDGR